MKQTRRAFVIQSIAGVTGAFAYANMNIAASVQEAVREADPQASSLGYKEDASKTDKKKYPQHVAGQQCNSCALYQGQAKDSVGICPIFAGKTVTAKGWCSAWAKKAA